MKREEVVRGLERFIDDYKRYINHADLQRLCNALASLKERGPKVKPQFDDDVLDRNAYIKVGDLIDCMTELSMPEDAAFHLTGAIEWACGKRAVALPKEQEARTLHVMEIKLDTVYWMEQRDIETPWPVAMKRLHGNLDFLAFEDYYGDEWDVSGYCAGEKGWRCWTARPTEEQMRETPWRR